MKLTTNELYLSRFIYSLEQDVEQWETTYSAGGYGQSWNEYHGPEYVNTEGERLQFAITLNSTGAYINGYMSWTIPFLNPFSYRCRRFIKAYRKMKKITKIKAQEQYNQKLLKAL